MGSVDLLQRHIFASAALAGLLLGGLVGLFFPIRAAAPVKAGGETWAVPSMADTKRFSEKAFLDVRGARFWKSAAGPGQRNAPALEWKLTGIITRPKLMAAVTSPRAKPPSMLVAVGNPLPDGSILLRMTRDAIWFEKDGCIRERRLFRAVTAENNACLGEAKPESAPTQPAKAASRSIGAEAGPRASAQTASPVAGSASP